MVERQLRPRRIRDERVLSAMLQIPREEFVSEPERERAYQDEPIAIGHGQTISQPYITAAMAQALHLRGSENVLDIGSGSGYHAALLGRLARTVTSVEIIPELAEYARQNLARTGLDANVKVICGDGVEAARELAPFDAISVAAGAPAVPAALVEQIAPHGRLVIPVGSMEDQELRVITRNGGALFSRIVSLCRFVPLRGSQGWHD
jgi:protein-L-isoaspartate(D-aspartate) O-methyltransferase